MALNPARGSRLRLASSRTRWRKLGSVASFTQGNTLSKTGALTMQVQQLFELAGKRGYRIESAGFGVQSVEADFEDAVRQLGFTIKDVYYRVRGGAASIGPGGGESGSIRQDLWTSIRFVSRKGYIAEVDLIRIRLQMVDFHVPGDRSRFRRARRLRAESAPTTPALARVDSWP
jgi:hypothetical protein